MTYNSKTYDVNQMHVDETRRKAERHRMAAEAVRTPSNWVRVMVSKIMPRHTNVEGDTENDAITWDMVRSV